ncbi:hypothetical protein UM93_16340 [Psychromicrobium lacuslunae]|uniref:M23ase beta-sheet core domain-containing protein n=2 Tax=Psychromicrobium lacuslunae TaxID=1618207 RepID=A0A0D4C3S9_9MICC|nr:hypothetical protein UM93_16340 [Psychromicrobium lacuslunae]
MATPVPLPLRPRDAARRARQRVEVARPELFAALPAAPAERGRRRAAAVATQRSSLTSLTSLTSPKVLQRTGIGLAAASLALAVLIPSAGASIAPASSTTPMAQSGSGPVSADPGVELSFSRPNSTSSMDPDGKLHQALSVSAAKVAPAAAKGSLSAPLTKLVPSSPFGYRVNPLTGAMGELHTGQDFAIACGTDVYAAAGGTVTFAGWHSGGGGNRVVVDHGNGLSTSYNHNSSLLVKVGQKVERGDKVALSGTTGASTGCHLHFEVMINDKTVDPMGWL